MKTPSVEPVLRSRLLPKISFRGMFGLMTLAAFLAALARTAGGGTSFAIGVLAAFVFIAACFVCFAFTFMVTWLFATLTYKGDPDQRTGSPFAADQLPPQILPPREREA
tara:strand:- start:17425 stop:17751 length:327 start_codon:yes stop_codon:yes gene_type:complete